MIPRFAMSYRSRFLVSAQPFIESTTAALVLL
jgi:hypothetical protein